MDERGRSLARTAIEAQLATKQARAAQRAKKATTRPWQVLEEEWYEEVVRVHGTDHKVTRWGPAEKSLARKFVSEQGSLDQAVHAIKQFISGWCPKHDKYPSMRLFWALRTQLSAEFGGLVKTKRQRLDLDEYNPERAKKFPKSGWGDE